MAILWLVLAVLACGPQVVSAKDQPKAIQGVLDLRQWDFERDGVVDLSGEYEFYWMRHLIPDELLDSTQPLHDGIITVPGVWNNKKVRGEKISGKGYATYRLTVLLEKPQQLAFEFADMATAYRVYADGEEVLSVGIPGTTALNTEPRYSTQVVEFTPARNQFTLLLLVSNFHHRKGGAWENIKLGLAKDVYRERSRSLFLLSLLFFSIATMGIYHIGLSFLGGIHRPLLLFGIFCILIALRSTMQGDIYLASFWPTLAWELLVKLEYLTYYLAVPMFSMFFYALYREEFSRSILRFILGVSLVFCAIVLFTPARIFSHTVPVHHIFTVLTAVYGIYLIYSCIKHRRQGAGLIFTGFSILCICILNDIFENIGLTSNPEILPFGVLAFIVFMTLVIASRFTAAFNIAEVQSHELSAANARLKEEILERKRTEEEKEALHDKLSQAEKMSAIGVLAGRVAHDLNNMLVGVTVLPDAMLLDLPADSPLREPLEEIRNAGIRTASVVQDLLGLTRRGVMQFEPLGMNSLIMDFLRSPEFKKLEEDHPDTSVKTSLAEDLFWIKGSAVHLRNTIMNLIKNAAEAMQNNGMICVSTENRYIDQLYRGYEDINEGTYAVLTVEDKGIGISPKDLERIFEPFYTRKEMGRSGTGLGMTAVWGTIHDHNGCIDLKSAEGGGTTISVYLPICRECHSSSDADTTTQGITGNNELILVVDDIAEQRSAATRALTALGYNSVSVASGEEAVEYIRNQSADLIVLDMIMNPGIDGLETYKRIIKIRPGTRAIIVSGYSETNAVNRAQKLGAGKYLRKPYTISELAKAVGEELSRKK